MSRLSPAILETSIVSSSVKTWVLEEADGTMTSCQMHNLIAFDEIQEYEMFRSPGTQSGGRHLLIAPSAAAAPSETHL